MAEDTQIVRLREAQARISHLEYLMYTPSATDHAAALVRDNDLLSGQVGRLELKIRKAARELER